MFLAGYIVGIFHPALNEVIGVSPMACGLLWHIAQALFAQEGPITNLSCHPSNRTGIFNLFSHSLDVLSA